VGRMGYSQSYITIDPSEYHVLHPRPAYLIVSVDKNGSLNAMAASWVMPVNDEPFILALALDKETKTYQNLVETGEFTVNVMGEEHAALVYRAGSLSGKNTDKWRLLKLEPQPSKQVRAPGVKGSYGFLECRVERFLDVESVSLVLARVLAIHVRGDLYEKYSWNLEKARILMHVRGRVFTVPGKIIIVPKS